MRWTPGVRRRVVGDMDTDDPAPFSVPDPAPGPSAPPTPSDAERDDGRRARDRVLVGSDETVPGRRS